MSTVSKRYAEDAAFREVADILFGAGGDELVHKMNPDGADVGTKKANRDKRLAQFGLASAGLGVAAAGQAVAQSGKNAVKAFKAPSAGSDAAKAVKGVGRLKRVAKNPKALALGAVGLQTGALAGDVINTHIVGQQATKKLQKSHSLVEDLKTSAGTSRGKLTRAAVTSAANAAGKGVQVGKGKVKKLPNKVVSKADLDVKWEGEFSKVNTDKQQVFGWASIVEMNGEPVVDLQGDYISIDEVEKAAYAYVHKSRKGGDMHLRDGDNPVHASDMIESLVITPEKKSALGLPEDTPTGWWVGYQVNDPDVWAKVKSGERTGFSIHGRGRRS